MGIIANAFTWWNGASWGTMIETRLRGEQVGEDAAGNLYFQGRKDPSRRWVIYKGSNDSSNVSPDWNAWLRGMIPNLPDKSLPPRFAYEREPKRNMTGSDEAWRPSGSIAQGGQRAPATGDYSAWTPDQA